jgi:uncharacterized sporulation protein YeaH/YhbH (DUF444 family)
MNASIRTHTRFRDIVRGRIKQNLRKYVTHGEMIGKQGGKDVVASPCRRSSCPRFTLRQERGDAASVRARAKRAKASDVQEGEGGGRGGRHTKASTSLEVDVELEELAQILGEELELPNIEPKGKKAVTSRGSQVPASASSVPRACGTSSAPSARR